MKKLLLLFVFSALIIPATVDFSLAARTTRDLVFEDDESVDSAKKEDSKTQTLALKSTIVLIRDGKTSTVVPSHEFKSGDKIKLVFTPNIDGYVYWLTKGSSGEYAVLFPSKKTNMDNAVKRNQEYTVPSKGAFKFDDKPGKEELLCILSAERLPDIDKIIAAGESLKTVTDGLQASSANKAGAAGANDRTTRDLVFEDEDEGDVNTKKQTTEKGKPMVTHFTLNHI